MKEKKKRKINDNTIYKNKLDKKEKERERQNTNRVKPKTCHIKTAIRFITTIAHSHIQRKKTETRIGILRYNYNYLVLHSVICICVVLVVVVVVHPFLLHRTSCSILLLLLSLPLPRPVTPVFGLAEWLNKGFYLFSFSREKNLDDVAWKSTQFRTAANRMTTWLTANSQPTWSATTNFKFYTDTLSEIEAEKCFIYLIRWIVFKIVL